jgi:predicted dehydrogenase
MRARPPKEICMPAPKAIVIGTGFGYITHLRALREAGFDVVGIVGRNAEKTADRAKRAGCQGLTSLDDALALPGVTVVSVATPPHTHLEIVSKAIAAGKHVVCEKPLARNAEEANQMADAAEKAGVQNLVGTEFRWATGQAVATRAIHEGVIGEPRLATFMMHQPGLADPKSEVPSWWSDASEGGGWLGAYASHVVDHMRHMFGEFEGVSASLGVTSDRDWTAEDTYTVHFRMRSGLAGVLQSTAGAWGAPLFAARVAGSRGTLNIEGDNVVVEDANGRRILEVPADLVNPAPDPIESDIIVTAYDMFHSMGIDIGPFTRLFEVLKARIEGKGGNEDPAPGTFRDGAAVMAVLDAIRRSSREHIWVPIK